MARNYAPLPYEYLEEMEALNDAEFGRLTRALLVYSMTGEPIALCGNERFYAKRVMAQEDRFKASYEEQSSALSERGKAGAQARWKNAKACKSNAKNAKACLSITSNAKNGNTETETETNTLPATAGKSCARATVAAAYLDKVNPSASQMSMEALGNFADEMGAEVCLRAIDIALDNKKSTWPYIRGILQKWQSLGVKCLADIETLDKKPEKRVLCPGYSAEQAKGRMQKDIEDLERLMKK